MGRMRPPPGQLDPGQAGDVWGGGGRAGRGKFRTLARGPGFDLIGEARTRGALPRSLL